MHVVCPRCNKGFPVGPAMAGQLIPCPWCTQQVRILPPPPPPSKGCKLDKPWRESPPVVQPLPPPFPRRPGDMPKWLWLTATVVFAIAWFVTRSSPSAGVAWANYSFLCVACFAFVGTVQVRWLPWWFFFAAAPTLSVVAIGFHAWTDTYVVHWDAINDPDALTWIGVTNSHYQDGSETSIWPLVRYHDTHVRWGGTKHPLYRRAECFSDASNLESSWAVLSGPMSPSGKLHGQWTMTLFGHPEDTAAWFWYGEEITEGEWHLRNR